MSLSTVVVDVVVVWDKTSVQPSWLDDAFVQMGKFRKKQPWSEKNVAFSQRDIHFLCKKMKKKENLNMTK